MTPTPAAVPATRALPEALPLSYALGTLQALAEPTRARIVEALREGERCVCEIQGGLDLPQPLLSHHLGVLREAGLVTTRREGRWIHYALVTPRLEELERALGSLRRDADAAACSPTPPSPSQCAP